MNSLLTLFLLRTNIDDVLLFFRRSLSCTFPLQILFLMQIVAAQQPQAFNPNASTDNFEYFDTSRDQLPAIWAGSQGNWTAAWARDQQFYDKFGQSLFAARSVDEGKTWFDQQLVFRTPQVEYISRVRMAGNQSGERMILWTSSIGQSINLIVSADDGKTWSNSRQLPLGSVLSELELAASGDGTWLILFDRAASSGDQKLMLARSSDLGAHWTTQQVTEFSPPPPGDYVESMLALAADAHGRSMIVSYDARGFYARYSADSGETWSEGVKVSGLNRIVSDPSLATDGQDNWLVTWSEDDGLAKVVKSRMTASPPDDWSSAISLTQGGGSAYLISSKSPFAEYLGDGKWVSVWKTSSSLIYSGPYVPPPGPNGIYYSITSEPANSWPSPEKLSGGAPAAVDSNGSGTLLVTRVVDNSPEGITHLDYDLQYKRTVDFGQTFSSDLTLNDDGIPTIGSEDLHPTVDHGSPTSPTIIAAWQTRGISGLPYDNDNGIVYRRSTDNGQTWSPVGYLSHPDNNLEDRYPLIRSDHHGTWIVIWQLNAGYTEQDLWYSRSIDDGKTWWWPKWLNTDHLTEGRYDSDFDADVATDGQGNWVAVWATDFRTTRTAANDSVEDIHVVGFNAAYSTDNNENWSDPIPVVSVAAPLGEFLPDYTAPHIAYNFDDNVATWLVTFATRDTMGGTMGDDSDVFIVRSTDLGQSWCAPIPLKPGSDSPDDGEDVNPVIASDNHGQFVIAWSSTDTMGGTIGYDYDLLASSSLDSGITWTTPEVVNSDAAADTFEDGRNARDLSLIFDEYSYEYLAAWCRLDQSRALADKDLVHAERHKFYRDWSPPMPINANADMDYGDDRHVAFTSLFVDPSNPPHGLAIWESNEPLDGIGHDFDVLSVRYAIESDNHASDWILYE